jgi:kynurenine formamidase
MGTHLDAPRHFVTKGKTIDQLPLDWLYGEGVIVDLSDQLDDLDVFTPEMIEKKAKINNGDILFINTGWHKFSFFSEDADEERYIQRHPGPHHSICEWLLDKKIHLWGVDMISTDHPMNLPIGRFLGKGGLEHWAKVRAQVEKKFGGPAKVDEMFPAEAYQLTHNALFPHDCVHVENMGGQMSDPALHNKRIVLGAFPWMFRGGEAAFCRAVAFTD